MVSADDPGSGRRRQFEALAAARSLASAGGDAPMHGRRHGVGFAKLVECLADPVCDPTDRAPEAGLGTASAQPIDTVAVQPRRGRRRLVRLPRLREAPEEGPVLDGPSDGARWVLAVAPERYDRSDVAGSETAVILDPIQQWAAHVGFARRGIDAGSVVRAWEAFSGDGEALGLILWTGDAFVGLGDVDRLDEESTLEGAAWQVSANR